MHAVVRNYSGKGSKKLIDVIEKNNTEVEGLLRAIKGFVSYYLVRTSRGGFRCPSTRTRPAPTRAFGWRGIGSVRTPAISAPPVRPSRKDGSLPIEVICDHLSLRAPRQLLCSLSDAGINMAEVDEAQ